MSDPFFDEDEGEFDDLYGTSHSSAFSSAPRRTPQSHNAPFSPLPMTPHSCSYAQSPGAASSLVSRSYARDRAGSWASIATDVASTGPPDRRRRRRSRTRHKGSQKLFDVPWQSNHLASTCSLCSATFSLVRRKHHCRPCGRVMCSDCSSFLYFELSHRKHRVCAWCHEHLLAEQETFDRKTLTDQRDLPACETLNESEQPSIVALTPGSMSNEAGTDRWLMKEMKEHKKELETQVREEMDTAYNGATRRTIDRKPGQEKEEETSNVLFDGADDDWFTDVPKQHGDDDGEKGEAKRLGWSNERKPASVVTDNSVQLGRIAGKDSFSEQFQYDVDGPGLGQDHERVDAMPRPTDQFVAAPFSYDDTAARQRPSRVDEESRRTTQGKRGDRTTALESSVKRMMTLDELEMSSLSERPDACMPCPRPAPASSTFYGKDADTLVVDDSPGFFEATKAKREAHLKEEEGRKRQLASGLAWVNSSAIPSTVGARRFASGQESYSLGNPSSHGSKPPSHTGHEDVGTCLSSEHKVTKSGKKGGFTNALKRFFGIKPKAKPGRPRAMTVPKAVNGTSAANASKKEQAERSPPKTDSNILIEAAKVDSKHAHDFPLEKSASRWLERHTLDYDGAAWQGLTTSRHTMATNGDGRDASSHFEALRALRNGMLNQENQYGSTTPERPRRNTFDDLFESPQKNTNGRNGDWLSTTDATKLAARGSENTNASSFAVGVPRFDQRRSGDEADGFLARVESLSLDRSTRKAKDSIDAWRDSAAMSLLNDHKRQSESELSRFTWSNVRSSPGFGTVTYAVPTSLQSCTGKEGDRGSSLRYDTVVDKSASFGTIMDDLNRGSAGKKTLNDDDIFAEFEEPHDYVFDPITGGYVAARPSPRARHASQSKSSESQSSLALTAKKDSVERTSNAVILSTESKALSVVSTKEEVADEVAEIIVDRISSLENELAALKQLVRNQKKSNDSQTPQARHLTLRPGVRKESIFDNDSSSDQDDENLYTKSTYSQSKRPSRRRLSTRLKTVERRKDSFADLFEDGPNENDVFGGTLSYETLFHTGDKMDEPSKGEGSDGDAEKLTKKIRKRSKSRNRASRTIKAFVPAEGDADRDEDVTSRREEQFSLRSIGETVDTSRNEMTPRHSDERLVMPLLVDVVPVTKGVRKQDGEDDPIDALFDISNDRDLTQLYRENDRQDEDTNTSTAVEDSVPTLNGTIALSSQASLTPLPNDAVNSFTSTSAPRLEVLASVSKPDDASLHSNKVETLAADEEEHFTINWTKLRKTKPRRHKSDTNPFANRGEGNATEIMTQGLVDEAKILDASSDVQMIDSSIKRAHDKESALLDGVAESASTWLSINTSEEIMSPLSLAGKDDLKQSVNGSKHRVATSVCAVEIEEQGIQTDDVPMNVTSFSTLDEVVGTGNRDSCANNTQAMVKIVAESQDSSSKDIPDFDIFDKSEDVTFVADDEHDSDEHESESTLDDVMPLIKTPTKRSSVFEKTGRSSSVFNASSLPLGQESPLSSSMASVDEHLELSKYAVASIPSVNCSLDDSDDVSGDEVGLDEVELQAFNTDWQQLQAKEKERKKRLQAKQRQAQRDKILRKQGVSSKSLATTAASNSAPRANRKKRDQDDATVSAMQLKKSGSSRRHRKPKRESAEPPRSLTEL